MGMENCQRTWQPPRLQFMTAELLQRPLLTKPLTASDATFSWSVFLKDLL